MPEKHSGIVLQMDINNGMCGVAECSTLKTGRRNNMLEAIIMTIGTIVFGVIMVFVTLFSVVSILVFYDRYSAKKMGKRRK